MTSIFSKLCLSDFFRGHVCSIPSDAADGQVIPRCHHEKTPLRQKEEFVWYFAFGSNLANSTFLGRRKQQPLKTIQAVAPGYILRFDIPGLPYQEPAFSSIRQRFSGEEDPDVIGIAYLLTGEEYERLLQSEGGRDGGYLEIDIEVKPLADLTNENAETIKCKSLSTKTPRENPCPLPSARYMSLIRGGAAEHKFPAEYQEYLANLPIYTISSWRTEIGRILFLLVWAPIVLPIFGLQAAFGKGGKVPGWIRWLQIRVFKAMWFAHDKVFSPLFGPGDITSEKEKLLHTVSKGS